MLFKTNLTRKWLDVLMLILATIAGLYGLNHLLRWFEHASESEAQLQRKETATTRGYLARKARR